MSKNKGDKVILGNSMQSLAALRANEPAGNGKIEMLMSNESIRKRIPEEHLEEINGMLTIRPEFREKYLPAQLAEHYDELHKSINGPRAYASIGSMGKGRVDLDLETDVHKKGVVVRVFRDGEILEEAIAAVKAMSPEELLAAGNRITKELVEITKELVDEPDHRGETSHGLNPKWIDWYCKANSCRVWKAIAEGKRRLRASKETPKRKKRSVNPK